MTQVWRRWQEASGTECRRADDLTCGFNVSDTLLQCKRQTTLLCKPHTGPGIPIEIHIRYALQDLNLSISAHALCTRI